MKNKLIKVQSFLYILIALTLFSCSEELYNVNSSEIKTKTIVTFQEFKSQTGLKNFELYKSVQLGGANVNARALPLEFAVDTTRIMNHISEQNKSSYTFRIIPIGTPIQTKEYYNLVYEKKGNNWEQIIFKNKEREQPALGQSKLQSSEVVYTSFSNIINLTQMHIASIAMAVACDGSCKPRPCDGFACLTGVCISTVVTYTYVSNNIGNNSGPLGVPNGGSDGSGGGEYNGEYVPNPYDNLDPSSPAFQFQHLVSQFIQSVSATHPTLTHLLSSNVYINPAITNYFIQNGLNPAKKEIMRNALINLIPISQANFGTLNEYEKNNCINWVLNYLLENNTAEDQQYISQFITQQQFNPDLSFDLEKSVKSPFNVDLDALRGDSAEEIKFREVYTSLKNSSTYKTLFSDIFENNIKYNTKFLIENLPQSTNPNEHLNGTCQLSFKTTNGIPVSYTNIIKIDRHHLLHKSKADIALTILHECIHAFLNVKFKNSSIGISIEDVNNKDFKQLINAVYNSFSNNQDQHNFFVDKMIPTMIAVLNEIKGNILTAQEIDQLENPTNGGAILYTPLNSPPTTVEPSDIQVSWNWNNFFKYFSYKGLQSCVAYPYHDNPPFSTLDDYYRNRYLSAFNTICNP